MGRPPVAVCITRHLAFPVQSTDGHLHYKALRISCPEHRWPFALQGASHFLSRAQVAVCITRRLTFPVQSTGGRLHYKAPHISCPDHECLFSAEPVGSRGIRVAVRWLSWSASEGLVWVR